MCMKEELVVAAGLSHLKFTNGNDPFSISVSKHELVPHLTAR
jgi:hypothetical protein